MPSTDRIIDAVKRNHGVPMKIFHLPDLGEGLPDAEIVEWHVKVGDKINNQRPSGFR